MMKFKFNKTVVKKKEKLEPIVNLRLEDDGSDGVSLIATTEKNQDWYLLKLNSNGTFTRHSDIEKSTGFKVSKAGYLKEQK